MLTIYANYLLNGFLIVGGAGIEVGGLLGLRVVVVGRLVGRLLSFLLYIFNHCKRWGLEVDIFKNASPVFKFPKLITLTLRSSRVLLVVRIISFQLFP